ncbi:MAG TPA: peptidyl-alpha-hydroxyglycine alpha-amidating lyase family protein [Pirellulales bacterium]|jgi:DNA-binding beta-propeller fold protein YncE|nr:peptidyl-alpha-hydroxyglycine alpha-amidating lyase family protein [Pirellulales bacterium]
MSVHIGSGQFTYEALADWESLPDGMRLIECPGVAVDADDQLYVMTRNPENPVLVFNREGDLLRQFGKGIFSSRTHGIVVAPDGSIFCVDDGTHTITKFTPDGELLMTIGTPNQAAKLWSGEPFNRPTHVAISAETGDIFITDGYGNARVHKYTADGHWIKSWGEPGIDAGQFNLPHAVVIVDERVYVAERENHRVQIFDVDGNTIGMWNNIFRPDGMAIGPDGNFYICELNLGGIEYAPGMGHRISVLSPEGKLLARAGHLMEGEEPGKFIAPHGIAVDSHGDIYIGEVAFTIRGRNMEPPRELKSLKKLRRVSV